jgi:DNA repair protein RadC
MLARRAPCECRQPPRPRRNPFLRPRTSLHAPRLRLARDAKEVELSFGRGTGCRPFLKVEKDEEKFAACNALADKIGPLREPKKVAEFLFDYLGNENEEVFGVLTLDIHGRLKGYTETGRGEASSVMAPVTPTVRAAVVSGGGGAILFHCHPSGVEAEPSEADEETTEAFADAIEAVGIRFIDHIIIAGDARRPSYYSFREDGAL